MSTVIFEIEGRESVKIDALPGENLLEVARRADVTVDAPCSGNGSCGKCRMQLREGSVESLRSHHISEEEWENGWRLCCCSKVMGDARIFVPDTASLLRFRMKTADLSSGREQEIFARLKQNLMDSGLSFTNGFKAVNLCMAEPSLEDTVPDNERLTDAIRECLGVQQVEIPYPVMQKLAKILREQNFHVCAKGLLAKNRFCCLDLCAAEDQRMVGCAIDIGTTTVSMVLIDLTAGEILAKGSCGNAQIRYGADVINRIIEQGKPGGRERLQEALIEQTLNPLLSGLCGEIGIQPECILRITVAANTTMNHLLLGVDAQSVRMEPYIPSFFSWGGVTAQELRLRANPLAEIRIAPNIGSYVGGDITAGTMACGIWDREEMSLMIDLGTNGEIVFGNREFLISCACSAGPAFEGGEISCGMRAVDGAIESCRMDPQTMEPIVRVIGNGRAAGICGSGIIDLIAELFRCGIISAKGKFIREGERIRTDSYGMPYYVIAQKEQSASGREIFINEVDIDNFIRAKGAIFSAVDTLLRAVEMPMDMIDRVYVAGGIGSGINMENAVRIGMFPDLRPDQFSYIGNSSLTGAYAMTVSDAAEEKCREIAAGMTYLELSTCPGYMDSFVAACFLPHTDSRMFTGMAQEEF